MRKAATLALLSLAAATLFLAAAAAASEYEVDGPSEEYAPDATLGRKLLATCPGGSHARFVWKSKAPITDNCVKTCQKIGPGWKSQSRNQKGSRSLCAVGIFPDGGGDPEWFSGVERWTDNVTTNGYNDPHGTPACWAAHYDNNNKPHTYIWDSHYDACGCYNDCCYSRTVKGKKKTYCHLKPQWVPHRLPITGKTCQQSCRDADKRYNAVTVNVGGLSSSHYVCRERDPNSPYAGFLGWNHAQSLNLDGSEYGNPDSCGSNGCQACEYVAGTNHGPIKKVISKTFECLCT